MVDMKTLQEKIQELENEGWVYAPEFRLTVKENTLVQFIALTKNNQYKKIENGKIYPAKSI